MLRLSHPRARVGVCLLAAALGVVAYRLLHEDLLQSVERSLPAVAIGWTAVAAGLVAAARRPHNRMGLLMVLYGLAVLIRPWQYSPDSLVFTVGLLLGQLNVALFAHVTLAYPSGVLSDRLERRFVDVSYVAALAFPFATLLFIAAGTGLRYAPDAPDSLLLVDANGELSRDIEAAFVFVGYGVLAAVFVALVVRKLVRATPAARRILSPLLLAALLASSRALTEFYETFGGDLPSRLAENEYWWQAVGQIALPLTLLAGLLTSRLSAAHVADVVRDIDRVPPSELAAALGDALGDESVQVFLWLPDQSGYADTDGVAVELPDDETRALTPVEHHGRKIAMLVHDPILLDDPDLIGVAVGAARLALENAQLQAEVKAQLDLVRESRARLVAAGDDERRRIERDLHDGAQQRLVALAVELRVASHREGAVIDPELERVLDDAVGQLQLAVTELRDLAHGVHPAILTDAGLGPALEALATRTPLPVRVAASPSERLPPAIEVAAYYVACEALANAVKHADASSVTITAVIANGSLVLEVADDGAGGADPTGSGLRGLADRVEAHGGTLAVTSAPGRGTRLVTELPCAS